MKHYTVIGNGPVVFSITADGKKTEHCLNKGAAVELPDDNPTVKKLVAQKKLAEVPTKVSGKK